MSRNGLILWVSMANRSDNPYLKYAQSFLDLVEREMRSPTELLSLRWEPAKPRLRRPDPFSPPDDECIVGGLPIRLLREAGFKIVNVAITLGSKVDRDGEAREC